jgi:hypothetical protein
MGAGSTPNTGQLAADIDESSAQPDEGARPSLYKWLGAKPLF